MTTFLLYRLNRHYGGRLNWTAYVDRQYRWVREAGHEWAHIVGCQEEINRFPLFIVDGHRFWMEWMQRNHCMKCEMHQKIIESVYWERDDLPTIWIDVDHVCVERRVSSRVQHFTGSSLKYGSSVRVSKYFKEFIHLPGAFRLAHRILWALLAVCSTFETLVREV